MSMQGYREELAILHISAIFPVSSECIKNEWQSSKRHYQTLSAVTQCLWTYIRRGSWWAAVIAAEWWQAAEVARRSEGHHWWPSWLQLGMGGRKGWGGTDPRPGRRAEARLHREGWGLHAGQLGTLQKDTNKDTFEFSLSSLCMQGPPISTFRVVRVRSFS